MAVGYTTETRELQELIHPSEELRKVFAQSSAQVDARGEDPVPAGYMADRFGARRLFLVGLIGTSVLSLGFALLHVYWLMVLNQAISGFFRALMFAPGLLLISALFSPDRRDGYGDLRCRWLHFECFAQCF